MPLSLDQTKLAPADDLVPLSTLSAGWGVGGRLQEAGRDAALPDGFEGNRGNPFFIFSLVVTILDPPGSE